MLNIIVVGIGGQGALTLSKAIARAAFRQGLDVKMAETHGLAQREGVIKCSIRIDKKVHTSILKQGSADVIIALEPLEAMRASNFASNKTIFVVNSKQNNPESVRLGMAKYPKIVLPGEVHMVDASRIVTDKLDSIYPLNMFMLGMASKYLPIEEEHLISAIKDLKKFDVNKKAFELGKE